MLRPRLTPIGPVTPLRPLPPCFSLLVWNVHKRPFSHLQRCLPLASHDLWLLQEAWLPTDHGDLPEHPWAMTPNLRRRRGHSGVLTASRFGLRPVHQHLSQQRELGLLTHKSALLTRHLLANGDALCVLNVHLLLTAPRHTLQYELTRLAETVRLHAGPLIVAGDFNSWSRPRLRLLRAWAETLDLRWPTPHHAHHVRHHRHRPLDHLLYRGLTLTAFTALAVPCSDHNPLVARFCYDA